MAAGELVSGATRGPGPSSAVPAELTGCRRVVAVTVHLPELLLNAAGLLQRLGAAGVPIDVLVAAESDRTADRAARSGLGELRVTGLQRHRLALPDPFGADRREDVVAAMSELVGFDPEPGVYCVAPHATEAESESSRETVGEAAQRIARAYGMPLVHFSAPPDDATTDFELDGDEWTRKYAGLAACATEIAPFSGRHEYFSLHPARPRP